MASNELNIAVIGGGPGGYAAAFLAADLGLKVTLIDAETNPGGVCLYRGCIPSKALLHVAAVISESRHAAAWGVEFGEPKVDVDKLRAFKEGVVKKLTGGLGQMSKMRKVTYVQGHASFVNSTTVKVAKTSGGEEQMSFDRIIIATGSRPAVIPAFNIQSPRVMDSSGALDLKDVPKTMLVIGGGYIGLELGTVYAALGTKVSVVEMMPGLLPGADRDLVLPPHKRMQKIFASIMLNTTVKSVKDEVSGVRVTFEGAEVQEKEQVFGKVLISVGRKPNSEIDGLEKTGVKVGTQVTWDTTAVATTYVSASEVRGLVPTASVTPGEHRVRLFTPAPGGGESVNSVTLNVNAGGYNIGVLVPGSASAGGGGFTLTVNGTGLTPDMVVLWNGNARTTTFVSATELRAAILASDIAMSGTATVSVRKGTTTSNTLTFSIRSTDPAIETLAPPNASAGAASMEIRINGQNFSSASQIQVNSTPRATTYVSATEIRGVLTSTDLATGGTVSIKVIDTVTGKTSAVASYSVADFGTQLDSAALNVSRGASTSTVLTLTPKFGSFDNPVSFSCSGLPAGATCSFSSNNMTPGASAVKSTITIFVPTSTARSERSVSFVLAMLGFGCFGLLQMGEIKRRIVRVVLWTLAICTLAIGMTSCGGGAGGSASTPGTNRVSTYTVTVNATAGNMQHSSTLTLTVQ